MKQKDIIDIYGEYPSKVWRLPKNYPRNHWIQRKTVNEYDRNIAEWIFTFRQNQPVKKCTFEEIEDIQNLYGWNLKWAICNKEINGQHQIENPYLLWRSSGSVYITLHLKLRSYSGKLNYILSRLNRGTPDFMYYTTSEEVVKTTKIFIENNIKILNENSLMDWLSANGWECNA